MNIELNVKILKIVIEAYLKEKHILYLIKMCMNNTLNERMKEYMCLYII